MEDFPLFLISIGLVVRTVLLFSTLQSYSFGKSLSYLLVGITGTNEHIVECSFLQSRGILALNDTCPDGFLYRLLYEILNQFSNNDKELVLKLISIFVQTILCALLNRMCNTKKCKTTQHGYYLYWLNPVVLLTCCLSAATCIHQLLLTVCCFVALNNMVGSTMISLMFLCNWHPFYVLVVPSLLCLANPHCSSKIFSSSICLALITMVLAGIAFIITTHRSIGISSFFCVLDDCGLSATLANLLDLTISYKHSHYTPAAGVLWYLEAQMFTEYGTYFNSILYMQRWLFPILLSPYICNIGALPSVSTVYLLLVVHRECIQTVPDIDCREKLLGYYRSTPDAECVVIVV